MISNLPPGCSQSDIDRAMGGVVTCVECGVERASSGDDVQAMRETAAG